MLTLEADQVTAVRVPVTVELSPDGYDKIISLIPGDEPGAAKFEGFMNTLCADFVGGGMMLSPEDMGRIHDVNPDAGPDEIIQAVAESAGMEDGQMVVKWTVDPSYWGPLQQAADTQGLEVQQVIQNLMDYAVNGGWFFALDPMPKPILMTPKDYEDLEKIIGKKDFTGTDIVAHIRALAGEFTFDDLPAAENTAVKTEAQAS